MAAKRYVRLEDSTVREVILVPEGFFVENMFHPSLVLQPCEDLEVVEGWKLSEGRFYPPDPAVIDPVQEQSALESTLQSLDAAMPRALEEVISLMKIEESNLSPEVQAVLNSKRSARDELRKVLERKSRS